MNDTGNTDASDLLTVSFDFPDIDEHCTLAFYSDRYVDNDNLALAAFNLSEDDDGFGEQWGMLTVNLPNNSVAARWCAEEGNIIIDTNNNPQVLVDAMVRDGIIELADKSVQSGFCPYPFATITPVALSKLRGLRETADLILSIHPELGREDTDPGISLKSEAEAMRESATHLDGYDVPVQDGPQR